MGITILILSIVGILLNWFSFIFGDKPLNLYLHAIGAVCTFHFSITLGIILIVIGSIALVINILILINE